MSSAFSGHSKVSSSLGFTRVCNHCVRVWEGSAGDPARALEGSMGFKGSQRAQPNLQHSGGFLHLKAFVTSRKAHQCIGLRHIAINDCVHCD